MNGRFVLMIYVLVILFGQNEELSCQVSDTTQNLKISAYPLLFYLPETRLGFGAAGIATFRFDNEKYESRPSQIQFGAAYTLNKQLLFFLPFEFYKQDELWKMEGELGYYNYFYNFYGIGINSQKSNEEKYFVKYPRAQVSVLKRFGRLFYVGMRYFYDGYNITEIKSGGLLEKNNILGAEGGRLSGAGLVLQYDSRDQLFYPRSGWFIEAIYHANRSWTGSDFRFTRNSLEFRHYCSVKRHVLAFNGFIGGISGDAPFNELYYFGSPKSSRGFLDRRFADNSIIQLQTEWRFPLWKRFGGVIFTSGATVADSVSALLGNEYKFASGAGIRFLMNKRDGVRLRLDLGFTEEGSALYVTVKEAF